MSVEIQVPRLAESVSEAVLVEWLKPDGAAVATDEPVAVLETDKAAVEIAAAATGTLRHARAVGDRVVVGDLLARIEPAAVTVAVPASAPAAGAGPAAQAPPAPAPGVAPSPAGDGHAEGRTLSPAVRRLVEEHGLEAAAIPATGPGGRLLKEDVLRHLEGREAKESAGSGAPAAADAASAATTAPPRAPAPTPAPALAATAAPPRAPAPAPAPARAETPAPPAAAAPPVGAEEEERAVPMSRIRQRIAERLVRSQHTAATLTTFNEIDMSAVLELRARHREAFEKRHGVRLGLMSFFTRAAVFALGEIPELNAEIRGTDIVYRRPVHMGIAVQTERGLVVPVVRGADALSFAGIERELARLADRARAGQLSLEELSGGTFTISNGGVYGSLLSTPILNPPQSGILGMHKIEKRPIALDDQVVIRPMMYVALSYDHRIVDGEQAVRFLVRVKDRLEDPERMLLDV
ncbi:MAG TPA: 2-oxoglutarate dehydrogenase complex dihydrolipoyllysine-residue succinyltransferase [Candidatus Eisenbacteria bacterium]